MVKVVKFGGSSLADAAQFAKVREIIRADETRAFVVPSAPGKRFDKDRKVTDLLYECYYARTDKDAFEKAFDLIAQRFLQIERELGVDAGMHATLETTKYEMLFQASPDYAASRGEFLNGKILAAYLGFPFVDAADVICFNENGTFNAELTDIALHTRLSGMKNAVIPGFYGAAPSGRIVTFSRGGSDITGSLVAVGVDADLYENWTDVSGCMMADPRIVPEAPPITVLTYHELRELAYMGATVMHEEAIYPARRAHIPIHILNTNAPNEPGTRIVLHESDCGDRPYVVTGIAGKKGFCIITLEKNRMHNEVGFGRKALSVLELHGISFEHMPSGIDTLSLLIEEKAIPDANRLITDLKRACGTDSVDILTGISLIAVVGHGMAGHKGTAATLFAAMADADVNIRMIDQGSSEMNIILAVEEKDYAPAVRAAFDAFVK